MRELTYSQFCEKIMNESNIVRRRIKPDKELKTSSKQNKLQKIELRWGSIYVYDYKVHIYKQLSPETVCIK